MAKPETQQPSTSALDPARATLETLQQGATLAQALAFFDSLPAVTIDQMIGSWRGEGLNTGNPLDGLLEAMHWHGKRFDAADRVDPLVMDGPRGHYTLNPAFMPLGAALRLGPLLHSPLVQRIARFTLPALRTSKPAARLRMIEYRGRVSGTMAYDAKPIHDHFRLVDSQTLLGAMDMRGLPNPFMFVLHRENTPSRSSAA